MNYRSIKQSLFYDPEFEPLSPLAQYLLVMLRLRSANIIALYRPDWDSIRGLLKVNDKELRALLDELAQKPWVVEERGFVWVINGFRYELGESKSGQTNAPNINHRNAVGNSLSSTPELHLVHWFANYYHNKGFGELFDEVIEPYSNPSDTLPTPLSCPARQSGSGSDSGSGSESGTGTVPSPKPSADGLELAKVLHSRILQNFPKARVSKFTGKELDERLNAWGLEMDKIMRVDKRTKFEMLSAINFAHDDNVPGPSKNGRKGFCWAAQLLSPSNLRNDNLWAQMVTATTPDKPKGIDYDREERYTEMMLAGRGK